MIFLFLSLHSLQMGGQREQNWYSRSLDQLSQGPEDLLDSLKPLMRFHCCLPEKPIEADNQWPIPGLIFSWWCLLHGPQGGNTPPYGLGLVSILGPSFLWKGSHQWLLHFFLFNSGTQGVGLGFPALGNLSIPEKLQSPFSFPWSLDSRASYHIL